jgi:hypothetical protein
MKIRLEKENLTLRVSVDNSHLNNPVIYKQWELLNQNNLILGKITKTVTKSGKVSYKVASTAIIGSYISHNDSHKCQIYLETFYKLSKAKSALIEAINFELTLIFEKYGQNI